MISNITDIIVSFRCYVVSDFFVTPWTVATAGLLCPWDFQGKNTGVHCCFFLQGILNPEIEPVSLSRQADSSLLKPRMLYLSLFNQSAQRLSEMRTCSRQEMNIIWIYLKSSPTTQEGHECIGD